MQVDSYIWWYKIFTIIICVPPTIAWWNDNLGAWFKWILCGCSLVLQICLLFGYLILFMITHYVTIIVIGYYVCIYLLCWYFLFLFFFFFLSFFFCFVSFFWGDCHKSKTFFKTLVFVFFFWCDLWHVTRTKVIFFSFSFLQIVILHYICLDFSVITVLNCLMT